MYDDDFLKNLHHVLLEVVINLSCYPHFILFYILIFVEDTRRRGINDLSQLRTCLPNLQWYPKHGMNRLSDSSFGKMNLKSNLLVTGRT